MVFTTLKEIVLCGFGAFDNRPEIKDQARSATGAALGSLILLSVSAWLSQPLYYQYAANQHAQSATVLGWVAACVVALLIFSFGSDIARNIARYMKGKPVDNSGAIALAVTIWVCLASFDILVQYYGAEIRARESSGDIRASLQEQKTTGSTVETDGNLTIVRGSVGAAASIAISPKVAAEYEALADVDFAKSWCGKHSTQHGNGYKSAMIQSGGGKWLFICPNQAASFGKKYDTQRAEILARIEEIRDLETAQEKIDQDALNDANAGIINIRTATEKSFKFLTFALYVICLGFSVKVCLFLEDLETLEGGTVAQSAPTGISTHKTARPATTPNKAAKTRFLSKFRDAGKKPITEPAQTTPSNPVNVPIGSLPAEPVAIPTAEPLKVLGGWEITCQHCGQKAIKSRPAIWCSDACRVAGNEAKTGKTLKRIPKELKMSKIGYK